MGVTVCVHELELMYAAERSEGAYTKDFLESLINSNRFATLASLWKMTFMRNEAETSSQRLSLPARREVRGGNMRNKRESTRQDMSLGTGGDAAASVEGGLYEDLLHRH